jgi:hypothetical protein
LLSELKRALPARALEIETPLSWGLAAAAGQTWPRASGN